MGFFDAKGRDFWSVWAGGSARSFHLIDFPLISEKAETVEWAHCSKIFGHA